MLELFNGPTSAFKDVALQILPRFMAHTTPADGDADEKIMILTATSGDTGKAALAGFADAPGSPSSTRKARSPRSRSCR